MGPCPLGAGRRGPRRHHQPAGAVRHIDMEERSHEPVMLAEALEALAVRPGGHYVDCTLGRGGHTTAILERGGQVLALDADPAAIAQAPDGVRAFQAYFDRLEEAAADFAPVDGVLFDLGLSSPQLEDPA